MWTYDKKLQFPVNIKQTNAKLAKAIITQYGGADTFYYNYVFATKKAHCFRENKGFYFLYVCNI